jgi:hypothetical protein
LGHHTERILGRVLSSQNCQAISVKKFFWDKKGRRDSS